MGLGLSYHNLDKINKNDKNDKNNKTNSGISRIEIMKNYGISPILIITYYFKFNRLFNNDF